MATVILYAATEHGYAVQTTEDGQIVDDYRAGNHRWDSQAYALPNTPDAVPPKTLHKWAKQTAEETAGKTGASVAYDDDLESTLREELEVNQ